MATFHPISAVCDQSGGISRKGPVAAVRNFLENVALDGASNMKHILLLCSGIVSLAGCNKPHAPPSGPQYTVLSITEFTGGKIAGVWPCEDDKGKPLPDPAGQCIPSTPILADAVWHCGGDVITIDRSRTHMGYVYFPIEAGPEAPSSLDIVSCVQKNIGFAFSAVRTPPLKLGENPVDLEGDPGPFLKLHSTKG